MFAYEQRKVCILRLFFFLPGNRFLKLAFFVCGIQKPDILQRMYVFLFPAGEDLIRILETGQVKIAEIKKDKKKLERKK